VKVIGYKICVKYMKVGFEVLTAVVTNTLIFWDITPYSPVKISRRFGGICHPHLQGRRVSQEGNQLESRWQAEPEDGDDMFLLNVD
jgi:hypothetical protein